MQGVSPHRHVSGMRRRGITLACIGWLAAVGVVALGQTADPPDQTSRKVRLRGGDDPNVKGDTAVNIRPAPITGKPQPPPPPKPSCSVTFDNKTTLYAKVFIDGVYTGTISPLGGLSVPAGLGSTVLYARAEYDDGSADAWGPIRINCRTKYTWRLAD